MPDAKQETDDSGGSTRAKEVNEAMLNVPGYGDDSVFFVLRYATGVKVSFLLF